ncbi:MAG: diacylglycerol/polyprenol kinase family protein [Candidatus Sumerlaeia bacterium]
MDKKEVLRKVYHIFGGMLTPCLYLFLERPSMLGISFMMMSFILILEAARLSNPALQAWIQSTIPIQFKEYETRNLCGQAGMQIGYFLTILLFQRELAIVAMCFLAIGDPLAALIGKPFGRHKIPGQGKSLEGSIACFLACIFIGTGIGFFVLGLPMWLILMGALVTTILEVQNFKIDDNFLIPVGAGLSMQIAWLAVL